MHNMLKRHQVQVLRAAGTLQREVVAQTGLSRRAVQRIEKEAPVAAISDAEERKRRRIGRPSKVEGIRPFVERVLKAEPDIMALELLRRARLDGYAGGKTVFYELVASLRPKSTAPIVRFEGVPGEFVQHDFGQVDVRFVDGSVKRIRFFASRYKYSRWVEVSIVPDERTETLVRALVEHYHRVGGVPLLGVFDRPATVVLQWRGNGEVTQWNPVFQSVMLELGVGVELCWPRSGNQKGSVENLVGFVKGSFFKQRRFLDEEDLHRQLGEWCLDVNTVRPCRATGVTPQARMLEERPRLRPVRIAPDELVLKFPVVVGPTAYVVHDTNAYSMPASTIGLPGTLLLYKDSLSILAGGKQANHARLRGRHQKSTLPEHRAEFVAAVSGKRATNYAKRQHLLELGSAVHDWLTEVIHRRERIWQSDVNSLFELLQQHGEEPLRHAIQEAHTRGVYGAEYVANLLRGAAAPVQP